MTGRERVWKVLHGELPDRTPIDLGAVTSTGISAFALRDLLRELGHEDEAVKVCDTFQVLGWVPECVRARFGIDVIGLALAPRNPEDPGWHGWEPRPGIRMEIPGDFTPQKNTEGEWTVRDKRWGDLWRMPANGFYFDAVVSRLGTDLLDLPPVPPLRDYDPFPEYTEEELAALGERAAFLWETTDYAIMGGCLGGNLFDLNIGGMMNWMMILAEPQRAREYVEKACDAMIKRARQLYDAVGDKVFAVVIGNDMGKQRGELYSPETFEKVSAPGYKRFCQWVHGNTSFKVFLHSCGSIYNYIPALIDCGIDILNPVQTNCANMEASRLKEEFGGRIVFWGGGCDTQKVLPFGSPEDVERDVRENMRIFADGGGYVFNQIHNIQANTPVENIITMLESALKCSKEGCA